MRCCLPYSYLLTLPLRCAGSIPERMKGQANVHCMWACVPGAVPRAQRQPQESGNFPTKMLEPTLRFGMGQRVLALILG